MHENNKVSLSAHVYQMENSTADQESVANCKKISNTNNSNLLEQTWLLQTKDFCWAL